MQTLDSSAGNYYNELARDQPQKPAEYLVSDMYCYLFDYVFTLCVRVCVCVCVCESMCLTTCVGQ